ncbi:MAG: hypothetical protein CMP09_12740 [Yangia sp.]|nr:hypothetical protein [Salipiger sp.]
MSFHEIPVLRMARDGRMRLTHGPIDLILTAEGPAEAARDALRRAHEAFEPVLHELCAELPRLRAAHGPAPRGAVARRMQNATDLFAPAFVTPMAAVAGSVADHVLAAMLVPGHGLTRAHINNGGDIALWTAAKPLRLSICEDPIIRAPGGRAEIGPDDGIGGVATSGWRGRSHSLGIADAVTVLARDAALADVAATLIANAVDLPGHPAVTRARACDLSPDSDLGALAVTTGVGRLTASEAREALAKGHALAQNYISRGLIRAACLALAGERTALGDAITEITEEEALHA